MFWTWEKTYTHTHTICSRSCRTTIIELHFEICPWVMVHSWHYRLLERCLNYSERIGWYAGDSHSAWCSPTVFVVKNDGSIRYWLSYHKFNEVSQFDTYPVPLVGKLLNRLDTACFFSQRWIWPRVTGRFPCFQSQKKKWPSPLHTDYTNLWHFSSAFSEARSLSSISWTLYGMMSSSIVTPGWSMCSEWPWSRSPWGRWDLRPTRKSVHLDGGVFGEPPERWAGTSAGAAFASCPHTQYHTQYLLCISSWDTHSSSVQTMPRCNGSLVWRIPTPRSPCGIWLSNLWSSRWSIGQGCRWSWLISSPASWETE